MIERHDGVVRRPAALAARAAELLPPGRAADFNQAMMELGATVCRPRAPRCARVPGARRLRRARRAAAARAAAPSGSRTRDRWARGRIVAALLAGEPPPAAIGGARRARVLAGLERDGLIERAADGEPRLPA